MKQQSPFIVLIILVCLLFNSCDKKSSTTPTPPTTSGPYFPKVKMIIQNKCLSCHSSTGSWTGRPTAFDTDSSIALAYASIKAAVADPETFTNKRMPQGDSLSVSDLTTIQNWYNKGGKITD